VSPALARNLRQLGPLCVIFGGVVVARPSAAGAAPTVHDGLSPQQVGGVGEASVGPKPSAAKPSAAKPSAAKPSGAKAPTKKPGPGHKARRFEHSVLVRPVRLVWPAADLAYQKKLSPAWSLDAGFTAGRYSPLFLKVVSDRVDEAQLTAPIGFLSGELGAAWHPNQRFYKGFRLGLDVKGVRMATTVAVQSSAEVRTEADALLIGVTPLLMTGYKYSWRSGFTLDLRLGAGPFFTQAQASGTTTATVDGAEVGSAEAQLEKAFALPWVASGIGLGWSF
jgi:hypothetical protein